MTPERWRRIEELFERASALTSPERKFFLDSECGDDAELRSQVEAMLAADEGQSFLDSGAAELGAAILLGKRSSEDPNIGRRIGNYRIIREAGRGGMGLVYEAVRDDSEFYQRAAVKLIKRGMDTDYILRRFRHERQILADLNHPNIARLLDGGTTDDKLPFFVMEFVEGQQINKFCDKNQLRMEDRLRLFMQVCSALEYAHKQNVIHRDIKPGNILVTSDGKVKLLDFGISKLLDPEQTDGSADSITGRTMMTPDYASPEQVRGEIATVSSDIYSLGVLLYKLLTGRSPYPEAKSGSPAMARAICEERPLPPSAASNSSVPSAIDQIVLKALEKDPAARFRSAAEMSMAIEEFLSGTAPEPVSEPSGFAASPGEKTIAVLPFSVVALKNSSDSADQSFMGIGLTDAFVTRLANVSGLVVRPTSSVLKYTDEHLDVFEVGRELSAAYVLQGRVVMSGERLRVTVQLVDIANRASLWASQYDEKFTDIFAVQDSISDKVTQALQFKMTPDERENLAKHGTENPEAYELYLRGRAVRHSYSEDAIGRAIQYFTGAIELDPNFAAAHSGIADLHVALGIVSALPPQQAFGTAKASAARAVELDPQLGEAWASLAFATLVHDWDAEESERLFEKAFSINKNFAPAYEWHAHLLASRARFDEAIEEMAKARRVDPRSCQLNAMTAYMYHTARRHAEGVRYIERAYELEPDNYLALQGFGWMYPPLGRAEEALPHCRRAVELSNRAPLCLWVLGELLASLGRPDETREIIRELIGERNSGYVPPYYVGMLYRAVGDHDDAVTWLGKAVDERSYWAQWFDVEYRIDALRQHEGFRELLGRLGSMKAAGATGERTHADERTGKTMTGRARRWRIPAAVGLIVVLLIPLGYWWRSRSAQRPADEARRILITRGTSSGDVASAVISTDGTRLAYVTGRVGKQTLWVKQLDSPNPLPIVADRDAQISSLAFTPDNNQLYYVEQPRQSLSGTLYRVASQGGQPSRVLDGVYGKVDFSPAGDRMTYRIRSTEPNGSSLLVASPSGDGARELAWRYAPGYVGNAAWSPDGKTVAYGASVDGSNGSQAIFLHSPDDDSAPRRITHDSWDVISNIDWAPDGESVFFNGQRRGEGSVQIWRASTSGASVERITNDSENYRGVSVGRSVGSVATIKTELRSSLWVGSLDQGKLDEQTTRRITTAARAGLFGIAWSTPDELIFSISESKFVDLWRMRLNESSPTGLIKSDAYSIMPVVSPDRRHIVYVSDLGGVNHLWRANLDGTDRVELTRGEEDLSPSFSADGKWVYFMQTTGGKTSLARVPLEGGEPVIIGDMAASYPAVSPGGKMIAFLLLQGGRTRIAVMPTDGTVPSKVFDTEIDVAGRAFYSSLLRWSADGLSIYSIRDVDGRSNVWSQPLNGGLPIPITNFNSEEIFYFDISSDGKNIALSRGGHTSDVIILTLPEK